MRAMPPCAPDIGGNPLQSHHSDGSGIFCDFGLFRSCHIHDHPAFQHFCKGHFYLEGPFFNAFECFFFHSSHSLIRFEKGLPDCVKRFPFLRLFNSERTEKSRSWSKSLLDNPLQILQRNLLERASFMFAKRHAWHKNGTGKGIE